LALSGLALAWAAAVAPDAWRETRIDRIAARLIAGDDFKSTALGELVPDVEALEARRRPSASATRGAAVIRLGLAERAIAEGDRQAFDGNLENLRRALARSLAD